jgi:hypothetical protein
MSTPGLLESMETMAKLWLADTASSPLLLPLLSFAFSLGSGNAKGSSNGLGDFPLLVFFFFVCVSPGFSSPVRFPLFVLPVSLPSSQFLSPVLGPCSLWFWFLLCPLFFLVSVPCVIRLPLVLYFHCSPFLLPVSPLYICLFSVFYALLVSFFVSVPFPPSIFAFFPFVFQFFFLFSPWFFPPSSVHSSFLL